MSNIVSIISGEALTTTLAIAEGVGRSPASLIKLLEHSYGRSIGRGCD